MIGRRCLLAGGFTAALSNLAHAKSAKTSLDHIVWLSADRDAAAATLYERTGLRAFVGGSHEDGGTHNAIVALGDLAYLEIISPLPRAQGGNLYVEKARRRPEPHVAAWSIRPTEPLEAVAERLKHAQVPAVGPFSMSRGSPSGRLSWRLLVPNPPSMGATVPFLIDWDDLQRHPSLEAGPRGRLVEISLGHPHPEALGALLSLLGVGQGVEAAKAPDARFVIEGPSGRMELAS